MKPYFEVMDLRVNHKSLKGTRNVLAIDQFGISKGKTFGIVGESGAGKTVLALSILRLLQCPPGEIESGRIILNGEDLLQKSEKHMQEKIRGKKLAMIFQDPMSTMNPVFTVGYQVAQVIKKNLTPKITDREAYCRAIEMIEKVKLPDAPDIMNKYPHELSGGQRQRVIIAMALACGAEFFIADEPTRNLDVTIQASILKMLKELQEQFQVTILFIANNLSLVSAFCDDMGVLCQGRIIEQGAVKQILNNPQQAYTQLLLESFTRKRVKPVRAWRSGEPLLEVKNLYKYFPVKKTRLNRSEQYVKAVDDISFTISRGEVLGIVGESGCGKSTLVNTILNLHEPTGGQVIFDGDNLFSIHPAALRKVRKKIQIVFQDPYWSMNPRWLVKDIIAEPIKVHDHLDTGELLKRVEELLEMVGLPKEASFRYPHEFSGGQRQRIAIARSLAVNPSLVVLDEPTSSIDVLSQAQILKLLEDLRERLNLTNILISHDLSVVNFMSDKIIVMYLGKIVEYGPSEAVFENPLHPYTRALFDSIPDLHNEGIQSLQTIEGNIPSAINPPGGCRFHTRCQHVMSRCRVDEPQMVDVDGSHYAACFLMSDYDSQPDRPDYYLKEDTK